MNGKTSRMYLLLWECTLKIGTISSCNFGQANSRHAQNTKLDCSRNANGNRSWPRSTGLPMEFEHIYVAGGRVRGLAAVEREIQ
jgi:hypothetical protein